MVTATQIGTALVFDDSKRSNWRRWQDYRRRLTGKTERGLTGHALEQAVMAIAQRFPENVITEAVA
jgi:hypothetical protein